MLETASFHIVKPCNLKCKFCYASFQDMRVLKQLPLEDAKIIIDKLKLGGLKKITFAGGEPMLYKNIFEIVEYSKRIGLTTSIITNGSFLTPEALLKFKDTLDWVGLSVDSLNAETNIKIGRGDKVDYLTLVKNIKALNFKLKINTVVNKFNEMEDLNNFIKWANPSRWKVFDTLKVEGQNDEDFESIKSTKGAFEEYVKRNKQAVIVPENNEVMRGSYLLIDPQGRLFENTNGSHTYSSRLQENDLLKCLGEINLNREMFIKRGGVYKWN